MALSVKDGGGVARTLKTTTSGSDLVPHHVVESSALPTGAATSAKQDTEIASLASILAKILTAPATEAKQDTGNTSLASILSKIIAAPSTEAKQDTQITHLSTIASNVAPSLTRFRNLAANSTAVAIKGSAGVLWSFNIINLATTDIYIKIYNIAAASVNPASDVPVMTLLVPTGGAIFQEPACALDSLGTAISVRAVTGSGDTNTTAPSTSPIIEIKYV